MILYHGTSKKHLEGILKKGILPNNKSNVESQWDIESAPDRVYFTDAYGLYFAMCAGDTTDTNGIILEVEIDDSLLLPDEDYLANEKALTDCRYKDTRTYRDTLYDRFNDEELNDLGIECISNMGTCCIRKGEVKILRYVEIPKEEFDKYIMGGCDPTICVMNYKFLGKHYKAMVNTLFFTHQVNQVNKIYTL